MGTVPDPDDDDLPWRRNLAAIWSGTFVGIVGAQFVFPFLPHYVEELGVEGSGRIAIVSGLAIGVTGLSMMCSAPVWGALSDRVGRKAMFLRALIGAAVIFALMGIAQAVWQLVVLRFLFGAFAGTVAAAAALVSATTPSRTRPKALSILQTANAAATMLGPVLGGVVAATLGIREAFFFCGALYLAAAIGALASISEPKIEHSREGGNGFRGLGAGMTADIRAMLGRREMLLILCLVFVVHSAMSFSRPIIPIQISQFTEVSQGLGSVDLELGLRSWQVDETLASGLTFGLLGAAGIIGALSIIPLSRSWGTKAAIIGTLGLGSIMYLPIGFAPSFTALLLGFLLVGLFQGAMIPATMILLAERTPSDAHGTAFGLALSANSLALLVGPSLGGISAALLGIAAVFVAVAVILAATAAATAVWLAKSATEIDQH